MRRGGSSLTHSARTLCPQSSCSFTGSHACCTPRNDDLGVERRVPPNNFWVASSNPVSWCSSKWFGLETLSTLVALILCSPSRPSPPFEHSEVNLKKHLRSPVSEASCNLRRQSLGKFKLAEDPGDRVRFSQIECSGSNCNSYFILILQSCQQYQYRVCHGGSSLSHSARTPFREQIFKIVGKPILGEN